MNDTASGDLNLDSAATRDLVAGFRAAMDRIRTEVSKVIVG